MSDIVIKAENLGKSYIIGHEKQERYTALRDVVVNKAKSIVSKTQQIFKGGQLIAGNELEEFWALKDLNFEIKQGDRVGIIGRNGAGKSTLLKVLSRITEPTTGRVTLRGRVASLLEVGTGFHPELTGRENIFLNGAILGMSRFEIKKKFDEIVDFSGVERFLDTPVKKYSSGMYVRLAFAVAAHMEPEILIVDEVLAVGDTEFQKKCLGKMEDVSAKEGRTVLFVSHNMQAISTLTNRCIILKNGEDIFDSNTAQAIIEYTNEVRLNNIDYKNILKPNKEPHITSIELKTSHPNGIQVHGDSCKFEIEIFTPRKLTDAAIAIQLVNQYDVAVTHFWLFDSERKVIRDKIGFLKFTCNIPKLMLFMGQYKSNIYFSEHSGNTRLETLKEICPFEVVMYGHQREHEWQEGSSVYLDNFSWDIKFI